MARRTGSFVIMQANFVKINLKHAVSVLVLDMHIRTFLFTTESN